MLTPLLDPGFWPSPPALAHAGVWVVATMAAAASAAAMLRMARRAFTARLGSARMHVKLLPPAVRRRELLDSAPRKAA